VNQFRLQLHAEVKSFLLHETTQMAHVTEARYRGTSCSQLANLVATGQVKLGRLSYAMHGVPKAS